MQHPAFPKADNTKQMDELGLALRAARPLEGYAVHRVTNAPPPGATRYQIALMGLLNLAVKQAEGVEWAMKAGNVPVAFTSLRVLTEMWINLSYLSSDPQHRERRACQILLENPERLLRLMTVQPSSTALPAAMVAQATKMIEDERDDLIKAIAALPRHLDDEDRWTTRKGGARGLSVKQRARLGNFDLAYEFLYEIGSAYTHGDGYAITHGGAFTPSDWVGIPEQAGLLLMTFASDVLDEFPDFERPEIVQAWNAYVACHTRA